MVSIRKSFSFISCILLSFAWQAAGAQNDWLVLNRWEQYSDAPNTLIHHVSNEALKLLEERRKKIAALQTPAQWKSRQQWIEKTLQKTVGPFPPKTDLQATVTRVIQKDFFRVEHIVYQSQPGYYVTASLFIPARLKNGKAPAIVYCSGHSDNGYRAYQQVLLNLVKKGFIVFAFDPISQGERVQHFKEDARSRFFKWPAFEHSYTGAQLFISGNTLAGNFIWDGIRAIDYLFSRKEVDTTRIGITGRSGGGTQSTCIAAFDDRIKAVAPENYITSFSALIQSIGLQDAEQNFLSGIREGLDMADLLILKAPRPALVLTTSRDMFPIEGARETEAELKRLYKAFNAEENFSLVTDDAPHASTEKNRVALYAFFQKVFSLPGSSADEKISFLSPAELQVTKTGQVTSSYLNSETAFSLNKWSLAKTLVLLHKERNSTGGSHRLIEKAKLLSGYQAPSFQSPVFMGAWIRPTYRIEKYRVETGKGYVIPYLILRPQQANGKAVIYLHPQGKLADTIAGSEMHALLQKGATIMAPDLVGTGEMGPGSFKGDSFIDSIAYNTWFTTVMTGNSIAGLQAGDISLLTQILKTDTSLHTIYGLAKSSMAPALLHAAAFDGTMAGIILITPYCSYRSIATLSRYKPGFLYSTVPQSVGAYDLPDLAASLAPRNLLLLNPTDGNGEHNGGDIEGDLAIIRQGYAKHPHSLKIIYNPSGQKLLAALNAWIINH